MTINRTKKSTYPSRYSPDCWVSAPQYITELICEKKARLDKKDLPTKFWELKEWRNFYRNQITAANTLLKKYKAEAIIAALRDKKTFRIFSLRAPWLSGIIEEHESLLSKKQEQGTPHIEIPDVDINEKPRVSKEKRNKLSNLKRLDE